MRMLAKLRVRWIERLVGEQLVRLSAVTAKVASRLLIDAQWGGKEPEWFDHRHHLLDPEKWFTDYWAVSACNTMRVLPLDGTLLDLCAGDGFYDYYFYRKRASRIVCLERDQSALAHARRYHSAANIEYRNEDVLRCQVEPAAFDTVLIRGAIEHFDAEGQQTIFRLAHRALKPGGWFCGDTPAKSKIGQQYLHAHEYEWADEAEMRRELAKVFDHIETESMSSHDPSIVGYTTLLWRCRKKA